MAAAEGEGSFLEQLVRAAYGGGGGSRPSFFPIVLGVMGSASEDEDQDSSSAPRRGDRIVLVNPVTQGMVVLRGDAELVSEILSDRRSGGPPPASKASIEALRAVEAGESEEECPVCLDGLGGGAAVVKEMPCRHRFHGGCIEKWLGMHGSCPVCRHQMPAEEAVGMKKGGGDGEEEEEEEGAGRRGREREREVWLTIAFSRRRPSEQQQQQQQQEEGEE